MEEKDVGCQGGTEFAMKVIFGGPTLHGADLPTAMPFQLRSPARQGDIYRAVKEGASVVGLIDGVYEQVPAVWHKEILFALSLGVHVYGAASMGALRAAECAVFGMIGFGKIYQDIVNGVVEDDAEVAQSHAPAELGFLPLSEPLANVRATLALCLEKGLITKGEHQMLLKLASSIFFKDRTYKSILSAARDIGPTRSAELLALLKTNGVNQKMADARQLIAAVVNAPDLRSDRPSSWIFEPTTMWTRFLQTETTIGARPRKP
jgi:hypothetical protein